MNATIVIYGSSTGTCEAIAEKIASKLGCEALNVQDLTARTDGARYVEVHEPLSCTTNELGIETR